MNGELNFIGCNEWDWAETVTVFLLYWAETVIFLLLFNSNFMVEQKDWFKQINFKSQPVVNPNWDKACK